MSNIKVTIAGRDIKVADGYEKPSAGDVNTCQVSLAIESGGVWDSLPHKRVTFSTRTTSVTVDYAPTITVPHEVLASPGALYLTLTGYDADGIEVARTHRMTYPIEVAKAGADEGAEPSSATLDVVSRIDNLASTLEASETTRQEAFESAQNERSSAFQASMSEWQQDVAESVSQASTAIEMANGAATNANEAATLANEAADNANEAANSIKQRAEAGEFNGKDGKDANATDVRINGTSITVDGVADIPLASNTHIGLVKLWEYGGLAYGEAGLETVPASEATISARNGSHYLIPADSRLDYAVKAAMCDGKGAAWTADEQQAARERMNAADADKVYIMQKQIENLQGIAATEETDSTEAYTKTVPTGAQKWASLDKVGGKTVVWNQLSAMKDVAASLTRDGVTRVKDSVLGTITLSGTSEVSSYDWIDHFVTTNGHKYLFFGCPAGGNDNPHELKFGVEGDNGYGNIFTETESGTTRYFTYHIEPGYNYANFVYRPRLVDLTQMFGAGNEPTDISDPRIYMIRRIAEARPEYNPGELMSAEVVEVESKGKNLLDFSTANADRWNVKMVPNPFKAGETYTVSAKEQPADNSRGFRFYLSRTGMETDKLLTNKYIGNKFSATETFTAPDDCGDYPYLNLAGSKNGVGFEYESFNLMAERGTIATTYSPYGVKGTFPIPDEVRNLCPGYGWSAGTVCNEIDFERKVYVKRVGSVDLGTLYWIEGTSSVGDRKRWQSAGVESLIKNYADSDTANIACAKYVAISAEKTWRANVGVSVSSNRRLFIYDDAYESVTEFKAAMQGVLLYYELAEPIEIDLSDVLPDDNFIEVEAGGTVTFKQASTQLPVPSSVTYQISTKEVIANA